MKWKLAFTASVLMLASALLTKWLMMRDEPDDTEGTIDEFVEECNTKSFRPCSCRVTEADKLQVKCSGVKAIDIQELFKQPFTDEIHEIILHLSSNLTELPESLLNDRSAKIIKIYGEGTQLNIDNRAFDGLNTVELYLHNVDVGHLDWQFLNHFPNLNEFHCLQCKNIDSLEAFPEMKSITVMDLSGSTGVKSGNFLWNVPSLRKISLRDCQLTNRALTNVIRFLGIATEGVEILDISSNRAITRFPSIAKLTRLSELNASYTAISTLESSSVNITSKNFKMLSLEGATLRTIEPDAFSGLFHRAHVYLSKNHLIDFPANVFKRMLEQMADGKVGFLNINLNPIYCDCSTAWFFLEERLFRRVRYGICADTGEKFKDMDPFPFRNCRASGRNNEEL